MTANAYLTTTEAAVYLKMSERTLARMRKWRKGPAWVKCGRRVLYPMDDVDAYLASQRWEPVRETG